MTLLSEVAAYKVKNRLQCVVYDLINIKQGKGMLASSIITQMQSVWETSRRN